MIWPDADEPGHGYARNVVAELSKLSSAPTVTIVASPAGAAEGWYAADALAEGWTYVQATELISAAQPATVGDTTTASRRKPAARDALIALLDDAELWHDAEQVAYATVPKNGHRENFEINSRSFRDWLAWRAYEATGASPAAKCSRMR